MSNDERTKNYENFNNLIDKIEFHEVKSSRCTIPAVETQIYATEGKLKELCEWLAIEEWARDKYEKQFFESNFANKMKSKAKDPNFQMRVGENLGGTSIIVHPKQNMVSVAIYGIHYICQHSFDMFPHDIRTVLMSSLGRQKLLIGLLYPKPVKGQVQTPIKVYNSDIDRGFMQTRETNLTYKDDFVTFIKAQRANEEKK
jgi:hypothetical protein